MDRDLRVRVLSWVVQDAIWELQDGGYQFEYKVNSRRFAVAALCGYPLDKTVRKTTNVIPERLIDDAFDRHFTYDPKKDYYTIHPKSYHWIKTRLLEIDHELLQKRGINKSAREEREGLKS